MNVRKAESGDFDDIAAMWREFDGEIPPPIHEESVEHEREIDEVAELISSEIAFVAQNDEGDSVGFVLARRGSPRSVTIEELYVTPEVRGSGIATNLLHEVVTAAREYGAEYIDLEVMASNTLARTLYARWGFREEFVHLVEEVAALEERLGAQESASFGSIHVQSDDLSGVEQAVRQFVPRLPGGSRGSLVAPPRHGWIAVYDDVCDRDPEMLRRLAKELADRMGAIVCLLGLERDELVRMICFEGGRIVDEYLSVPQYYGPLPPGDVVGLQANPRVVSRLTGADPEAIRRIARTAAAPSDLEPARELLAALAEAMGIEGAERGWGDGTEIVGAVRIDRA
ncbi:MAG: GNAT family N-acetyltransferase [Gaiellaceae bacterium]